MHHAFLPRSGFSLMFQVEHVAPILLHHQAIHHVLVRKKPPKHDGCVPIGISSKNLFFASEDVERNQNENVKGNAVCSKPGTPFATFFAVAPHLDPFSNFP